MDIQNFSGVSTLQWITLDCFSAPFVFVTETPRCSGFLWVCFSNFVELIDRLESRDFLVLVIFLPNFLNLLVWIVKLIKFEITTSEVGLTLYSISLLIGSAFQSRNFNCWEFFERVGNLWILLSVFESGVSFRIC